VDYLRMALFGLPTLSAEQLSAWEDATATYFEEFYNDASVTSDVIRDSVSDVSTEYDVTSLNAAAGRRRLRRTQSESAFLLTFTQTTQYSADDRFSIEQVIQHPFSDSSFRDNYVAYLKGVSEPLFDDLTGVSAIMIPVPFNSRVVSVADSSSPSSEGTGSPMSLSIENGAPSSTAETSGGLYGENFYCHNSQKLVPQGIVLMVTFACSSLTVNSLPSLRFQVRRPCPMIRRLTLLILLWPGALRPKKTSAQPRLQQALL